MTEKEFIFDCKMEDLLIKNRRSFIYEKLVILHFYDDNVSCYLTYYSDDKVNKDNKFQINFCIDNEELYLTDYLLIEDKILKDREILFNFMEKSLNIFSSNVKKGKYNDFDYTDLGGTLFLK